MAKKTAKAWARLSDGRAVEVPDGETWKVGDTAGALVVALLSPPSAWRCDDPRLKGYVPERSLLLFEDEEVLHLAIASSDLSGPAPAPADADPFEYSVRVPVLITIAIRNSFYSNADFFIKSRVPRQIRDQLTRFRLEKSADNLLAPHSVREAESAIAVQLGDDFPSFDEVYVRYSSRGMSDIPLDRFASEAQLGRLVRALCRLREARGALEMPLASDPHLDRILDLAFAVGALSREAELKALLSRDVDAARNVKTGGGKGTKRAAQVRHEKMLQDAREVCDFIRDEIAPYLTEGKAYTPSDLIRKYFGKRGEHVSERTMRDYIDLGIKNGWLDVRLA